MTELSFLIELLLNHELSKPTKDLIAARIKEVESKLSPRAPEPVTWRPPPGQPMQAPSTLALMAKHGDVPVTHVPEMPPVEPVTQIAQTPATAAAMNARHEAISSAISGKIEKGRTSPRKF